MREFFELLNEYPWTSIFIGFFILAVIDGVANIFKRN